MSLSWLETRQLTDLATDSILTHCLAEFGQIRLTVTGTCMEPHLRAGDRVRVVARRPRVGDVVLARHPRGLSLHRLVWGPLWLRGGLFRTQADRGRCWDPAVDGASILGTVVEVDGRGPLPRRTLRALGSVALGLLTRARKIFSR